VPASSSWTGNLKETTFKDLVEKKPSEVTRRRFRSAVVSQH